MATPGQDRDRDLRVVAGAIFVSGVGDWVALVALALEAKELSGDGMGGGIAIAPPGPSGC